MRAVYSSFLAALVIVALFWGNCFSCPQLLITVQAKAGDHSCCKRSTHQTQVPVSKDCQTVGLKHFVKTDPAKAPQLHAAAVMLAAAAPAAVPAQVIAPALRFHSPPDPLTQTSSLRI